MPFGSGGAQYKLSAKVQGDGFSSLQSKIGGVQSSMGKLKTVAGGVSLALGGLAAGGIAKSVQAAADFQGAMQESLAIMGDVSDAMREDMSQAARDVAKQTTFSANQAAESYFFLASAGLDAKESMEALPQVAEFAQAGMFDMEKATDLLTDSASALGVEMDNLSQLGDKFVKANTLANTSVEQIAQAMTNKAAPAMKNLGVQTDQGIAALSVFADQGLKGQRAGTILARTLQGLGKQAQENAGAFEELGISVFDNEGNMRNLDSIVQDMEQSLGGMSAKQRQAALSQLGFNRRAKQGIDLLLGNSQQLSEYESELKNAGGTASDVADKQLQSFNSQLKLLKSQIFDIGITIGKAFLPILTKIVKQVRPVLDAFSKWIGSLSKTELAIGSAATTIGLLGAGLAALVGGPITLAIGAVAGLAAAFATDFAGIRSAVMPVINVLKQEFLATITELKMTVMPIIQSLSELWQSHSGDVQSSVGQLVSFLQNTLIAGIRSAGEFIRNQLARIRTFWVAHKDQIMGVIRGVITIFNDLVSRAVTIFRNVRNSFMTHMGPILSELQTLRDRIMTVLMPAFQAFVNFIRNNWPLIRTQITNVLNTVVPLISGLADAVLRVARIILNVINGDFKEAWSLAKSLVTDTVRGIWEWLKSTGVSLLKTAFKLIAEGILAIGGWLVEQLIGGEGGSGGIIGGMIDSIVNFFTGIGTDDVKAAFKAIGKGIRTTALLIFDVGGWLWKIITGFVESAVDYFKNDAKSDARAAIKVMFDAVVSGAKTTLEMLTPPDGLIVQIIGDIVSFIKNDAPGLLKGAAEAAFDAIIAAGEGLYEGLIGGSLIPSMFSDIVSYIRNDAASDLASAARDAAQSLADSFVNKFNSIIPDAIDIPRVRIGGGKIDNPLPGGDDFNLPSATLGGGSWDMPQLASGGLIEDPGVAFLHAGEQVVPAADVDRSQGGGGDTYVELTVDTIHADDPEDAAEQLADALRAENFNKAR